MKRENQTLRDPSGVIFRDFERYVDNFFDNRSPTLNDWPEFSRSLNTELRETEKAFVLNAEVPGIPKAEIHVSVDGGVLMISAEHSEEEGKPDQSRGYRREYQNFQECFALPTDIDAEAIDARCENGLLEIWMPKLAASAPRQIEIRSGASDDISKADPIKSSEPGKTL